MIKEAIDNGLLMENGEKRSQKRSDLTISEDKNGQKQPILAENDEGKSQKPSDLTEKDSKKIINRPFLISRQYLSGTSMNLLDKTAKRNILGSKTI